MSIAHFHTQYFSDIILADIIILCSYYFYLMLIKILKVDYLLHYFNYKSKF